MVGKGTAGAGWPCVALIDNKQLSIDTILRQEVNRKVNSSMPMVSDATHVPRLCCGPVRAVES
jgi:hypothetical protein